MRRVPLVIFFISVFILHDTVSPARNATPRYAGWKSFEGAWFEISYPPGFIARPSKKSATAESGYDSAFFTSPDGLAEFYVFAPQWNGEPNDIRLDPSAERLVSQKRDRQGERVIRWFEIRATNGSYLRAYVDTFDEGQNTRVVFGFKYRDARAHQRNRDLYLLFKDSLVQFSD